MTYNPVIASYKTSALKWLYLSMIKSGPVFYLPASLLTVSKLWDPSFSFNYLKQIHLYQCFNNRLKEGTLTSQHYGDVIIGTMASQITRLTIVYSNVYSAADQRKHQSSESLAFVKGIHRGPVNSPHKWSVKRKMFPFDDVIMSRPHTWLAIVSNSTSGHQNVLNSKVIRSDQTTQHILKQTTKTIMCQA